MINVDEGRQAGSHACLLSPWTSLKLQDVRTDRTLTNSLSHRTFGGLTLYFMSQGQVPTDRCGATNGGPVRAFDSADSEQGGRYDAFLNLSHRAPDRCQRNRTDRRPDRQECQGHRHGQ